MSGARDILQLLNHAHTTSPSLFSKKMVVVGSSRKTWASLPAFPVGKPFALSLGEP